MSYDLEAVLRRAKSEIRQDIKGGRVPSDVASFAALHDFVDANEYGGACEWPEAEWGTDRFWRFWNDVQNALDSWIKADRP
jgi:hypothetical protein